MAWGAVAGAAVSVIGGALLSDDGGGGNQGQQAQQSNVQAERLYGQQADTGAWQLEVSKEMLDIYKNETLPLIRSLQDDIEHEGGEEGAAAEARGDVAGQYSVARQGLKRDMELGGRASDDVYSQNLAQLRGAESGDIATAIYKAKENERTQAWNRRLQAIAAYGDPSGAAAAGAAQSSASTGAAASGQRATALNYLYGQQNAQNQAQQSGYAWGNLATRGINAIMGQQQPPAPVESREIYYSPGSGYDDPFNYNYGGGGGGFGGSSGGSAPSWSNDMNFRHGGAIHAYADGGEISGPGTGTSDSVPTVKRPGSFILSKDVVQAIGTKKARDIMEKAGVREGDGENADPRGVAIRTSNGEWVMPPEVTKYYGEEFFNKLQQKYHKPIANDEDGMANGGAIRRRSLPRSVEDAIFKSVPAKAIGRL